MVSQYKHGDRIVWRYCKQHNTNKVETKNGYYVCMYGGKNPDGYVWVKIDGNKNRSRVLYAQLDRY